MSGHVFDMAYANRWEDVFQCIANGTHEINVYSPKGMTLLHVAAGKGNVEAGKRLLQLGADFTLRSAHGFTAMLKAVWNGHADFCAILPRDCLLDSPFLFGTVLKYAFHAWWAGCSTAGVILWLLQQPEFDVTAESFDCPIPTYYKPLEFDCVQTAFAAAVARQQRRWSAPRAAWLAACCINK